MFKVQMLVLVSTRTQRTCIFTCNLHMKTGDLTWSFERASRRITCVLVMTQTTEIIKDEQLWVDEDQQRQKLLFIKTHLCAARSFSPLQTRAGNRKYLC